jgi:AcrR family transcriptional regulator
MPSESQFREDIDLGEIVNRANIFLHPADEHGKRRLALLRAAFDVIAEVGFEGLRTRAVAQRAGVNIATLHYYFPTKQQLIEGVAEWMGARFVTLHGPSPQPSGIPALDRLRQEFSDGLFYRLEHPELLLVIQEFSLRGKRDPEVQKIVLQLNGYWRSGLEYLIRSGIDEGSFRNDLPVADLLTFVMVALTGVADIPRDQIERLRSHVETWILSDSAKAKLAHSTQLEREVTP